MMTKEQVKKWVAELAQMVNDDERAHSEEDSIHQAVLLAISTGECDDPKGCAAEALKTQALSFSRWRA